MPRNQDLLIPLPSNWYEFVPIENIDHALPGIYVWEIEGVGKYVGKYTRISRPKLHYGSIVRRLLKKNLIARATRMAFEGYIEP